MGIKLVVTEEPAVSAEELAIYMAESLQGAINAEKDAVAYQQQMQIENQKLVQLRFTVDQVKQYRKNPPANPSRMDPMLSYNLDSLQEEMGLCKERVQQWTEIRAGCLQKVATCQAETARLHKELQERKKKG